MARMALRIGIDTGGTFTDLVGHDLDANRFIYAKSPSTPGDPAAALTSVLADPQLDAETLDRIVVATTVATNAILQRQGSRVLYVTTAGFEDIPFIGRIDKEELYNLNWKKPKPLVERRDCFGVSERVTHTGEALTPLGPDSLEALLTFVAARRAGTPDLAVAVSLLFAYVRPDHEVRIGEALAAAFPELVVSLSHQVAPIWREYERGSTTIGDAFVGPTIRSYVAGVRAALATSGRRAAVSMMKSNGGHLGVAQAPSQPAQFLLSGLAGGIIAAHTYARQAGITHAFSLDMGGTSADIGTIAAGDVRLVPEYNVSFGVPVAIPSVDVVTIGAGGGSIAWLDRGGLLQVGPESAGAQPGPMCYGQGGARPTTTDANLALGRLNPAYFLGGRVPLDSAAATGALRAIGLALEAPPGRAVELAAHAIVDTANENMANQIRLLAVDRGLDPREFALIPFGGAGPLHARACAALLGISRLLVPPHPGLSSAFGAAVARLRVDRSRTLIGDLATLDLARANQILAELTGDAVAELRADGHDAAPVLVRGIDLRYAGQNYEREVSLPDGDLNPATLTELQRRFAEQHREFYGFALADEPIETVTLRVSAIATAEPVVASEPPPPDATPGPRQTRPVAFRETGFIETRVLRRETLPAGFRFTGPAIIEDPDSTTIIHPGDQGVIRPDGLIDVHLATTPATTPERAAQT